MGILNITDDSFYDGGRHMSLDSALHRATIMLSEGASIIDVGGMSSRPGAEAISEKEEMERIIPVISVLRDKLQEAIISVDTYRSAVAREAVNAGASIINDISAGSFDKEMFQTIAQLQVPYILMHMKGSPVNMQLNPEYSDVTLNILDFFIEKVGQLRELGVKDIVIDPGFGFGKTIEHNYRLLNLLHVFKITGLPILVGISRKSMIYKVLENTAQEALNGTSALHMFALQQGASILRAHDVKEAREVVSLFHKLNEAQ